MKIKRFRDDSFIDRVQEIEFFKDYFEQLPQRVLFVYGPKSIGKTTLIEYIIENELFENFLLFKSPKYNIKYINLRGSLVTTYKNFIEKFVKREDKKLFNKISASLKLKYFEIEADIYEKLKKREIDVFDAIIEEFKRSRKQNILIIDEIQTLQEIYVNKNRLLLNEFLNFCIRLTKETHLSHVLILTSNTIFLNTIYNNSKMKKASIFKPIDHLPYKEIEAWLTTNYRFSIENCQLIYDYLGGCVSDIKKLLSNYKYSNSIKEYLNKEVEIAKNEIIFTKNNSLTNEQYKIFLEISSSIVKNGKYVFDEEDEKKREKIKEVISIFCDLEILFFDPIKNVITANSRVYVKAFEII